MYYMNKVTRLIYRINAENRVEHYNRIKGEWVECYSIFAHEIMAHVASGYFVEVDSNLNEVKK